MEGGFRVSQALRFSPSKGANKKNQAVSLPITNGDVTPRYSVPYLFLASLIRHLICNVGIGHHFNLSMVTSLQYHTITFYALKLNALKTRDHWPMVNLQSQDVAFVA